MTQSYRFKKRRIYKKDFFHCCDCGEKIKEKYIISIVCNFGWGEIEMFICGKCFNGERLNSIDLPDLIQEIYELKTNDIIFSNGKLKPLIKNLKQ